MVDAAGAIYVIGGTDSKDYGRTGYYYKDVWVSTDGGARPDSRRGWSWSTGWVLQGTRGKLRGYYTGTKGVLRGTPGVLGVLEGYWGTEAGT